MLIGITGLTESGKDQIVDIVKNNCKDHIIIDTNKIFSILFQKNNQCYQELLSIFGTTILRQGQITQQSLYSIAFRGKDNAEKLNTLLGKHMKTAIYIIRNSNPKSDLILDIGLLINYKLADVCDKVIITTASLETRAKRLSEHTKVSYESAYKRLVIQYPLIYDSNNCIYISTDNGIDDIESQKIINFIKQ